MNIPENKCLWNLKINAGEKLQLPKYESAVLYMRNETALEKNAQTKVYVCRSLCHI